MLTSKTHPFRILTITTIARTNEVFLADINERLSNFDHYAAAIDMSESLAKKYYKATLNLSMSRSYRAVLSIKKVRHELQYFVEEHEIDLIHVHTPIAAFIVRYIFRNYLTAKKQKLPIVYTAHGFHFFPGNSVLKNWIYLTLEKISAAWTDKLIVINNTDYFAALKYKMIRPEKLLQIPGIGIDLSLYKCAPNEYSRSNKKSFLCIAEFIPRKNHRDIIIALKKTKQDFSIKFAGDGELLQSIQNLVSKLDLDTRVEFLGYRDDIVKLIDECDGLILVSSQEGLPRSILEGMSMGKIIIGSNIRGIKDLLEYGAGILVEVGDTTALAQMMDDIIINPDNYNAMKYKAGKASIKYDVNNIVRIHEDLYNELIF